MVFLIELFERVDFEKNQRITKKHEKFPRRQRFYPFLYWRHVNGSTMIDSVDTGEMPQNENFMKVYTICYMSAMFVKVPV